MMFAGERVMDAAAEQDECGRIHNSALGLVEAKRGFLNLTRCLLEDRRETGPGSGHIFTSIFEIVQQRNEGNERALRWIALIPSWHSSPECWFTSP